MELKNKIILVVGAAGLIGSEFSQSLIDNGAICILADRDSSKLNKLKKKLNCNKPNQIDIKKVDILNEKQIISLRKYINIRYKRLDGVVNLVANDPKMTNNKTNFKTFEDQIGYLLLTKNIYYNEQTLYPETWFYRCPYEKSLKLKTVSFEEAKEKNKYKESLIQRYKYIFAQ